MSHFHCHIFRTSKSNIKISSRLVYLNKKAESEPYTEITKEGEKLTPQDEKAKLRATYEETRDKVRAELKKYEPQKDRYEVFWNYAQSRLNQVDRDLGRFDVLDPKSIKDNLKKLQSILVFTSTESLKEKRKSVIAAIEKQKQNKLKMLEDRYNDQVSMLTYEVKPETIEFAKKEYATTKAKISAVYNSRIQGVDTSMAKQNDPKWGNVEDRAETLMLYLDSVEEGLSSNEKGSSASDADQLFKDYETAVRGQYCIEMSKQGAVERNVLTTCLEYKIQYTANDKKDVYQKFDDLQKKYVNLLDKVKGSDAYKVKAVIYGQFLDEIRSLRQSLFGEGKDVPSRNFGLAAVEQVNAARKPGERGWDEIKENAFQLTSYSKSGNEFIMKRGEAVHFVSKDSATSGMNGVAIDYVHGGEVVTVLGSNEVEVNKKKYLQVEVKDKKGNIRASGWVLADALEPTSKAAKIGSKKKSGLDA